MEGLCGEPGPHPDAARGQELPGVAQACTMLRKGAAVVVPNPAPMAYGVVATDACAVNALKRRPLDRNVAVSMHKDARWRDVASVADLPATARRAVVALVRLQRLALIVPLRDGVTVPRWISPAVRNGHLAVFDGFWMPTARVWEEFPCLYGSSANITGRPPATTAEEAVAAFGGQCAVIDGAAVTGPPGPRWASTMVRIDRTGRLGLHRPGADDEASALSTVQYLRQLEHAVGLSGDGPGAASSTYEVLG